MEKRIEKTCGNCYNEFEMTSKMIQQDNEYCNAAQYVRCPKCQRKVPVTMSDK